MQHAEEDGLCDIGIDSINRTFPRGISKTIFGTYEPKESLNIASFLNL